MQVNLSDSAYHKLPYYIRVFTSTSANYNVLHVKKWALQELGAPCVPEYRIFNTVYLYVRKTTHSSAKDVRLEITEREKLFSGDTK